MLLILSQKMVFEALEHQKGELLTYSSFSVIFSTFVSSSFGEEAFTVTGSSSFYRMLELRSAKISCLLLMRKFPFGHQELIKSDDFLFRHYPKI